MTGRHDPSDFGTRNIELVKPPVEDALWIAPFAASSFTSSVMALVFCASNCILIGALP